MKLFIPLFILLISSPSFTASKVIVLNRVELTMEELIVEAQKQTGIELDVQVRESKAVKMFYDCTINLQDLLLAIKGYYKNKADLDIQVIKTEKGYWIGIISEIYVEPVVEKPIEAIVEEKEIVEEPKKIIQKKDKPVKKLKKNVQAAKKKLSNFFNKLRHKLKGELGKHKKKKVVKEKEQINNLSNILKYNTQINMKPHKEDDGKTKDKKFNLSPSIKNSHQKSGVIDLELNKTKKNTKDYEHSKFTQRGLELEL